MRIVIASGKGGTGKTLIATNLALAAKAVLIDLDVEEPNDYLFVRGKDRRLGITHRMVPYVHKKKCILCGECTKVCTFHALAKLPGNILVFNELCHDCGACALFCPVKAIEYRKHPVGEVLEIKGKDIYLIYGRLRVGEAMATPLIRAVKKEIPKKGISILDCPPGTSCPVIESMKGSDYCLLVTEPTPFGLHDLKLAVSVARMLKIPTGVVVNKYGIGGNEVDRFCKKNKIPILGKIPFDRKVAECYSTGNLVYHMHKRYTELFNNLWMTIKVEAER
jgi:MinD superfamily P-loop ATPase